MITYRLAIETDYKNINNFYNKINKSRRTIEEFYWLFHDSPFGKSIYIVAEDKNQIIGTNCVIPFDLIDSNKNIIKTGKSEDTLVDPKYRGQGIFYKIYEVLFEKCQANNIKVIWGFTSALNPFRKLGFKTPFSFQQSITTNHIFQTYKQLSTNNNNNSTSKKIKILLLSTLSKVNNLTNYNSNINEFKLLTDKEIINGVDTLIHSNLSEFNSSFSIHQNSNFQKWRIYNNPNYHKIHTFAFYDKNEVLKTLVLLNSKPNGTANFIQTSFHNSLSKKDRIRLLNHVTHKMFKLGFYLLRNWIFNTNPINIEEKNTFKASHIIINRGLSIVWKNLSNKNYSAHDFYLSKIASQGNS